MNAVVYYSDTGASKAVAEFFAERTGYPLTDIYDCCERTFDNLVLVFPVHSQNVPDAVSAFLKSVRIKNLTAIATYGKMCHGNVLFELQNKYRQNIVAAAYVPTRHAYLGDKLFEDFSLLDPVAEKTLRPSPVKVPRSYKNVFAGFFPETRARLGVKIIKNAACIGCGKCDKVCPRGAIKNGVPDDKCIRCVKCVSARLEGALDFKLTFFMRLYLKKKQKTDVEIYV